MLWDRGENDGYAQHLTTTRCPAPNAHQVLIFDAFGDHQVANVATEVMARTAHVHPAGPALADGRTTDVEPFWGITPISRLPKRPARSS